jgi:hypothetical protein
MRKRQRLPVRSAARNKEELQTMKTDVIRIAPTGEGIREALVETEKAASFRGLDPKQTLRLRLLAEEMTGMLRTIVGETDLRYWVESEDMTFSLHLSGRAMMDPETREALMKASTSGKNEASKGFMGRLRSIFTALSATNDVSTLASEYGYAYVDYIGYDPTMDMSPNAMMYGWSMSAYRDAVEQHKDEEKWDELEKSITAKLADDVRIFIRGSKVEMVIEKTF